MKSQLKKHRDYDSLYHEDRSFAGRFKYLAIGCGGALLIVALAIVGLFFIVIIFGLGGTR